MRGGWERKRNGNGRKTERGDKRKEKKKQRKKQERG